MPNALEDLRAIADQGASQVVEHSDLLVQAITVELPQARALAQYHFTNRTRIGRIGLADATRVTAIALRQPRRYL